MHRTRVVMVSGNAPPVLDGVGDCVSYLMAELARQRPEWGWYWVCRRPRWFHSPIVFRDGVTLVRPHHGWTARGIARATSAVRRLRPDILHVQEQIHSFYESDAAVAIAGAAPVPLVTTLHEFHVELPSVRHTIDLVKRSDLIIANDARNAERSREHAGREVDHRWWSANTVLPPDPSWGVRPIPGVAATFGFISGLKALPTVHESLKRLRPAHPDLRWRIIGPFHPESNADHAALSRTIDGDWVEFTGGFPVRDRRLRTLLGEAQTMLLPYTDGASLRRTTLQAAWAFGMAVVTTPPPHPEPEIKDGENCLLVPDLDPEKWASAVGRLLADPALAARLRAGSLATAERLGWARLARLHLEAYDALLARAGRAVAR
jgi:glycosyltransferase involved in cell wall biosynthesis